MKLFALHTMSADFVNGIFDLGGVKLFKTFEEAITERDQIVMELRDDYDFEEEAVDIRDKGFDIFINLNADSFYQIKIQEIEI